MSFVRQSKYRHVFGAEAKLQYQFLELRPYVSAWDSNWVAASSQYFAFSSLGGGGAVHILKYEQAGKLKGKEVIIDAHSGKMQDLNFSPFNPLLLGTCAMDLDAKIWLLPKETIDKKSTFNEPAVTLSGHDKRVGMIKFHPTADNTVMTGAADGLIKFWDIESGKEALNIDCLETSQAHDLAFNKNGSQFVFTSKDKYLKICDPRTNKLAATTEGHQGTRGSRCLWMGNHDKIFTCGSTKLSERDYMLWDPRNFDKPMISQVIDVGAGMIMPFYDEDSSMLFLAGKGDGNIRYFEIVPDDQFFYLVDAFKSTKAQLGMAMCPKYMLDTTQCETTRLLKLLSDSIVPLSFCVPRKATYFQSDIYPDTAGPQPAMTHQEWIEGKDADPIMISLDPKKNPDLAEMLVKTTDFSSSQEKSAPKTKLPKVVSDPKSLAAQNEQFRERIETLEKENFALVEEVALLKEQLAGKSE
jgi:coronin-1B/1C/6